MQEHMRCIKNCVRELKPFFEKVIVADWDGATENHKMILKLEEQADEIKKEIRLHMPNSLFLPVSRSDLLGLLTMQDKIATGAKHLSGLILTRKMNFPNQMQAMISDFVQKNIDATRLANKAIQELDDLVETGFRGKEVDIVQNMVLELDAIERATDKMQVNLRAALFQIEKNLNPVDVIFYYKIIDWLGELSDKSQLVGHKLETMVAR